MNYAEFTLLTIRKRRKWSTNLPPTSEQELNCKANKYGCYFGLFNTNALDQSLQLELDGHSKVNESLKLKKRHFRTKKQPSENEIDYGFRLA